MPTQHYEQGNYRAEITSQRFGMTPKDTPYFELSFRPIEATGVNALPDTIYERELVIYFSDKAASYSVEKLRRLGWDGTLIKTLDPQAHDFYSLAGTVADVYCKYNEKGYEQWDLSGGNSSPKESQAGVADKIDKLFGKALKSTPPKGAKPEKAALPSMVEDDVVPF